MNLVAAGMTLAPPAMLVLGVSSSPHCALMCAPMTQLSGSNRGWSSLVSLNVGRLSTYALLGAAAGGFGGSVFLALDRIGAGTTIRWTAAAIMMAFGIARLAASRPVRPCCPTPLTHKLALLPALVRGALWGLIPCPLLYAVLGLATLTCSPYQGALVALCFGIGTTPLLLTVSGLGAAFRGRLSESALRKFGGSILVLSGIWIAVNTTTASWVTSVFCR